MKNEFAVKAGKARAKSLAPERRKEIARKAVMTRWAKESVKKGVHQVVAGSPDKPLKIGDIEIECYVLDNGQRVISGRGMQRALGIENSAGNRLLQFLNKKAVKPYVEAKFTLENFKPIQFLAPTRNNVAVNALGFDANILKTICDVVLEYRRDKINKLTKFDTNLADKAELLLSGFASVGIIALIDEVTGYQDMRSKDALQKILSAYISPELLPWTRRFPPEFYKQLFRVYGWEFLPLSVKKPKAVGSLTNKLIYEKLPQGVLEELKAKNPKNENGNRNYKHHQFLSEEIGNPHLEKQILKVTTLLQVSNSKEEFKSFFIRAFPENPNQLVFD